MGSPERLDFAARFRLERRVGRGAFGEVFRAVDGATGELVAVKRLLESHDETAGDRFDREARILAEVESPHVVRFVAYGRDADGRRCLALEWLDGDDLARRQRRAPLSVAAAVDVARQAALGLAALHARGVVHRDVKPSNFFVTDAPSPALKLLDLGIARVRAEDGLTREGTQIGTPSYMSPEQARGDEDVGPASDLFSLGVLLYELLTRTKPFAGDRSLVVLAKIVLHEPPPLDRVAPSLPGSLVAIVRRAMEKSPERRFASAEHMAEALASLDGLDARPPAVAPAPPAEAGTQRLSTRSAHVSATRERRVVTAVFAGFADAPDPETAIAHFRDMAERLGGVAHRTLGFRAIAVFGESRTRGDEALRAARLARAAATELEGVELSIATGRALSDDRGLSADAIERGAGARPPPGAV
ncbi:MAG TPA: serine/threonine-protein kinase, partial [Minicystis sp.]|nr:serine/threonine-protein kinase [Minicystis sp.]